MKKLSIVFFAFIMAALLAALTYTVGAAEPSLTLKYNNVGGSFAPRDGNMICIFNTTNQYSSPVICDLDGDGAQEIVFCNAAINVADAATGQIKWRVNAGYDRTTAFSAGADIGVTFGDIAVRDIDGDGMTEIISCHGGGWVSVLTGDGYFKPGWPRKISDYLCTGLAVGDTDGDGKCEIAVALGATDAKSVCLLDCTGNIMDGWPQLSDDQKYDNSGADTDRAYSYGIFQGGVAMCDLTGDGKLDILAATDTAFTDAYDYRGRLIRANENIFNGRSWGAVGFYESGESEAKLKFSNKWLADAEPSFYMTEAPEMRRHAELGHSVIVPCDLDGDGTEELLISGVMVDAQIDYNKNTGAYTGTQYMTFFICNRDRTRYKNDTLGYDWTVCPTDALMGGQILDDAAYSLASTVRSIPVVSDIDGDGIMDIMLNTYDGKLHCFSLDDASAEKEGFPYSLNCHDDIAEFACAPKCVDINCDGKKELIFATFTLNRANSGDTKQKGRLLILDSVGKLLCADNLPDSYLVYETLLESYTNGCKATVDVGDINGDGKYEVAVNTMLGSLCVYTIENSTTEEYSPYHCFTDVREKSWYYKAVEYCAHNGIFTGTSETTFSPSGIMTREMFVVVMAGLSGEEIPVCTQSSFADVPVGRWYSDAVEWAYGKGLTSGMGNGLFGRGMNVTRQQIPVFLAKFHEYMGGDISARADITRFTDYESISGWAVNGVSWAVHEELMVGNTDGSFAPDRAVKRSEAAQIFYKLYSR